LLLASAAAGIDAAASAWPRRRASVRAGLTAGWLAACLLVLPEFNPLWAVPHRSGDETFESPYMKAVKVDLPTASDLRRPAVVLITYRAGDDPNAEAVYNTDVAWPDNAPIIYAHDLGPARNPEIFRYYADRQPDRFFYRWDRRTGRVEELGVARDLVR
ncbi:MAG: hypothetical protein JWO31_2852, partial [Phycisphaerales bacterium]|nr:hypothetical protein [Phycisphaerales bacterium]